MRVTGFEVFPVVCPPPFRGGRGWLFVRLDTDGGTHGYGEMMLLGTQRAAAILNFDAGQVGGILEAKKIASMAEAHYVQVAPHVYGGPLIAAAALHLSLSSPNFLIMEAIERLDGVHSQFVETPFDWRDGYLMPPRRPGLGFDLREDVARSHAPRGPQPAAIRSY